MHTVVTLSGGMDSSTVLYLEAARTAAGGRLTAVSVNYGQRHARELQAAGEVLGALDNHRDDLELDSIELNCDLTTLGGNALIDSHIAVPHGHYADDSMRATVVPNRNTILASLTVAAAVARNADRVVLGIHAGDHPVYADCRPVFLDRLAALTAVSTPDGVDITVEAPFVHTDKAGIARLGAELGVPFELTWSCYQGGARHCGRCGTCVERREAFDLAGVNDPTEYEA